MPRPFYFGAGPAQIPTEVLLEVQNELLNWQGTQLSILEIGHRTSVFEALMGLLEKELRALLNIPSHYHVLLMGCPARAHFGLIPLHFLSEQEQAAYWISGYWSTSAYQEASKLRRAHRIEWWGDEPSELMRERSSYFYCTPNETMDGVRYYPPPRAFSKPMIADMTSCLLSEPIRIEDYAMIFAGCQKNLGAAGLSVVIVEDAFLNQAKTAAIPTYLDYRTYANTHSLCVTPPTFQCHLTLKMLKWMQAQGGVAALSSVNEQKAKSLYDYLDTTDFYQTKVPVSVRSKMNITFHLKDKQLEATFFEEAKAAALIGLNGHRFVGGVRVSLYNAMPMEGVTHLIHFMKAFEKKYG